MAIHVLLIPSDPGRAPEITHLDRPVDVVRLLRERGMNLLQVSPHRRDNQGYVVHYGTYGPVNTRAERMFGMEIHGDVLVRGETTSDFSVADVPMWIVSDAAADPVPEV